MKVIFAVHDVHEQVPIGVEPLSANAKCEDKFA